MEQYYDLFVIGTGSGGSDAAQMCREAGWKVAIADRLPFGGTCSLRGCNPKKTLASAAEMINRYNHMKDKGLIGSISMDWNRLMQFKRTLVEPIPQMKERAFTSMGIDQFHGTCRFTGKNSVTVNGDSFRARHVLVATGSRPADFPFPGSEYLTHSDRFLDLDNLPSRVVFLGGGYISFEFAHIAASAGAKVTILEAAERPLRKFDSQLVDMLVDASKKAGIEIHTSAPVQSIEKGEGEFFIHAGSYRLTADLVVHGGGRVPDLDDLDLKAGEIEREGKGISINGYLQSTSNSAVYVAGDANQFGIQLTPVAEMESRIAGHNMLYGNSKRPDYSAFGSAVFTNPSLGAVGLTEQDARQKKIDCDIQFMDTSSKHITRRLGLTHSGFKIISEKGSGKILGAHMLGHGSEEVINTFVTAIKSGLTVKQLKEMEFVFPTVVYDIVNRLN